MIIIMNVVFIFSCYVDIIITTVTSAVIYTTCQDLFLIVALFPYFFSFEFNLEKC